LIAKQRDAGLLAKPPGKKIGATRDPISPPTLTEIGIDKHTADDACQTRCLPRYTDRFNRGDKGMADEASKLGLSPEHQQMILDALSEKWKEPRTCPVCRTDKWTLAGHLTTPVLLGVENSISLGGPTYPTISVICNNCGFIQQFNAIVLGVAKPPDSKETSSTSATEAKDVDK